MSSYQLKTLNTSGVGKNRYRFRGFFERIDSITLNVSSNKLFDAATQALTGEKTDLQRTYFAQTLARLRAYDRTALFKQYSNDVRDYTSSLPTILTHHSQILDNTLSALHRALDTDGASIQTYLNTHHRIIT